MANLIRALNTRLAQERKDLASKARIAKDPEVRQTLGIIGRAAGKHKVTTVMYYIAPPEVTILLEDLDSLKNGPVAKLLERLIDAGVEFTHSYDCQESRNRDHNGRLNGVRVRVSCYLKPEASDCKLIVTGKTTETVTRPTYELVCA